MGATPDRRQPHPLTWPVQHLRSVSLGGIPILVTVVTRLKLKTNALDLLFYNIRLHTNALCLVYGKEKNRPKLKPIKFYHKINSVRNLTILRRIKIYCLRPWWVLFRIKLPFLDIFSLIKNTTATPE